jgi:hypothetical protein
MTEAQTRRYAHAIATLCGVKNISQRTRLVTAIYDDEVLRSKLHDLFEGVWEKNRSMSKKQTS